MSALLQSIILITSIFIIVKSYAFNLHSTIFYYIFVIFLFINILFSSNYDYGFDKAMFLLFYATLGFIVWNIPDEYRFKDLFLYIIVFYIIFTMSFIGTPLEIFTLGRFERFGAELFNPIFLGTVYFLFSLYLILIKKRSNRHTIFCFILALICIVYGVACGSKGPLISFLLVLMLQSIRSAFAVLIFGLLIVSIVDLPEFVTQRFLNIGSFTSRLELNQISFLEREFMEFFWGCGSGCYSIIAFNTSERIYPHFLPSEVFIEYGIVGLIFVLLYLIHIYKLASDLNRALITFLLVASLTTGDLLQHSILLFLFPLLIKTNFKKGSVVS